MRFFFSARVLLALCFAAVVPGLHADQYAVMNTGARVRIDRYTSAGPLTNLFLPGGGVVEVNTAEIARFEADEYTPPPPPPPAAPAAGQGANVSGQDLNEIIRATGERHGLDPDLIRSVIHAESGGNPRAVSPKGASGLMQLMPGTARQLNVSNSFDPAQNVDAGTRYLRQLLAQYGNSLPLALAAYNAGPKKVDAYKGIPPYRETYNYVSRIIQSFNQQKLAQRASVQ